MEEESMLFSFYTSDKLLSQVKGKVCEIKKNVRLDLNSIWWIRGIIPVSSHNLEDQESFAMFYNAALTIIL